MSETIFCYRHPTRETLLRCISCGNPICADCAVHSPTGYRCPDCTRRLEKKFVTAHWYDYVSAGLITIFGSLLTSLLIALLGTFGGFLIWFVILGIAGGAGGGIAEIVRWATRKRRSPWLFRTAAAGMVVGALPILLLNLLILNIYALALLAVYLLIATPLVYGRLAGIRLS